MKKILAWIIMVIVIVFLVAIEIASVIDAISRGMIVPFLIGITVVAIGIVIVRWALKEIIDD